MYFFLKVLYEDEHRRRSKEVHQPGIQYLQPTARTPSGGGGHGAHAHGAHASAMYMKPHPQILMQGETQTTIQVNKLNDLNSLNFKQI